MCASVTVYIYDVFVRRTVFVSFILYESLVRQLELKYMHICDHAYPRRILSSDHVHGTMFALGTCEKKSMCR